MLSFILESFKRAGFEEAKILLPGLIILLGMGLMLSVAGCTCTHPFTDAQGACGSGQHCRHGTFADRRYFKERLVSWRGQAQPTFRGTIAIRPGYG